MYVLQRQQFSWLLLWLGPVAALLAVVAPAALPAGAPIDSSGGPGLRHMTFYSQALKRTMEYWIYLPPQYDDGERRFPVLFMLHGRDATCEQWRHFGLFAWADRLIRSEQIAPLIIVAPQGDFGYWMNHVGAGPRWGDYVAEDLVAHIDASYRTIPEGARRAIGGVSMGGHGAIQLAINHTGLFAVVGAHSPVFRSEAEAFPFFGRGLEYRQRDPVSLVQARPDAVTFALWLDIGAGDPWLAPAATFHRLLAQYHIDHSWHIGPGGHDGAYWKSQIPAYLRWYDRALRKVGDVAGAGHDE